jgi:hypothetical protein
VNGRGAVEYKAAKARMPKVAHAVLGQLMRHCDNNAAAVPREGKDPPTMADLAKGAKHSLRSTQRGLRWLEANHWLLRYPSPRGTVAGQLQPGDEDRLPLEVLRTCDWPPCGRPLRGKHSHARYCSDRCSKAARRKLADIKARAEAAAKRDRIPDTVRLSCPDKRDRIPDKPQVRPQMGASCIETTQGPASALAKEARSEPVVGEVVESAHARSDAGGGSRRVQGGAALPGGGPGRTWRPGTLLAASR